MYKAFPFAGWLKKKPPTMSTPQAVHSSCGRSDSQQSLHMMSPQFASTRPAFRQRTRPCIRYWHRNKDWYSLRHILSYSNVILSCWFNSWCWALKLWSSLLSKVFSWIPWLICDCRMSFSFKSSVCAARSIVSSLTIEAIDWAQLLVTLNVASMFAT